MVLVVGVDCSTQATKLVVVDADCGTVVATARQSHPDATEIDPRIWSAALDGVLAAIPGQQRGDIGAIAVGGQQHGMVLLDETGTPVRAALLWNDVRSAPDARDLVDELGGPQPWAAAVGSVPGPSFTVTKLRWVARVEPERAASAVAVVLPHDWLTSRLITSRGDMVTDRGDASGTGYYSPAANSYRPDLVALALGHELELPRVLAPCEIAGETRDGWAVAAGTGDNMAAALGLGLQPGDVVVSVGTSGTVFTRSDHPWADATGVVAGFAAASGDFLPLVCTLNAARVLDATAAMLGTDHAGLDRLALEAAPGAAGLVLLPYLDGERTPNLPDAAGSLHGLRRAAMTPANVARAAVEGLVCGLADGLAALTAGDVVPRRVLLIGGGALSRAVRAVAAAVFGVPVLVPVPGEYVALGAAGQAAWALSADAEPPDWPVDVAATVEPPGEDAGAAILEHYRAVRRRIWGV